MSVQSYLESVWDGTHQPSFPVHAVLGALAKGYEQYALRRAEAYRSGALDVESAPMPVVGVGNLTVGGSGKTPLVIWLAQGLVRRGLRPVIVSRGYGGRRRVSVIEPFDLSSVDPDQCGDEPLLLAMRTGCPVVTSADRLVACRIAGGRFAPDLVLLDDGFQHQRLGRDLDIVVLGGAEPGAAVLPAGPLREPLSALARADAVVDAGGGVLTDVVADLERSGVHSAADGFTMRRSAEALVEDVSAPGDPGTLAALAGTRVLAVSAIARPERFTALLAEAGAELLAELRFPDHHRFADRDWSRIQKAATKADLIVTTEKDLVKLGRLGTGPVPMAALRLAVEVSGGERLLDRISVMSLVGRGVAGPRYRARVV